MLCPNCKTENDDSANFCTNCRASLKETPTQPESATTAAPTAPAEPVKTAETAAPELKTAPTSPSASTNTSNFFKFMLDVCLKPMTVFKENLPKFSNIKNASIITAIIVVVMTLLSTITMVVNTVRTEECIEGCSIFSSKSERKVETKWEWDNLEDAELPKYIGETFLMNACTILILSGAYFGMSKAFKSKTADFSRMMTVVALGFIPSMVLGFIAPIIGGINLTIGGIIGLAGTAYSLCIIFVGLNNESGIEGDKRVYLNIASMVCVMVAYYVLVRFKYGELGGEAFKLILQSGAGKFDLSGLMGAGSKYF